MDALNFFGAVWISIVVGVFLIALVLGCAFDRHGQESPKWFITVAFIAFLLWAWPHPLDWRVILWQSVLSGIGIYLLIGLVYSLVEFIVDIRKSKRQWSKTWNQFRVMYPHIRTRGSHWVEVHENEDGAREMDDIEKRKYKVEQFINHHRGRDSHRHRIISLEATEDGMDIEPNINKSTLAENVGCWTLWWPFYLIGLVLGDLLIEVFETIASFIASLSGRFVKMSFKNVFR